MPAEKSISIGFRVTPEFKRLLELAAKRRELERALVAAEETWLELSMKAEATN